MSPIALAPSCPNTPRVSDRGAVRHRIPEISPFRPTSGISTHLDAMRPLPSWRTLRTLALNARCTPSATPALFASTTTSSTGGFSTTPGKETLGVSLRCMSDLLASDRSTERRVRPVYERDRRRLEDRVYDGLREITSCHGIDSRPLSDWLYAGRAAAARRCQKLTNNACIAICQWGWRSSRE